MTTTALLVCYCHTRHEAETSDDPVLPPAICTFVWGRNGRGDRPECQAGKSIYFNKSRFLRGSEIRKSCQKDKISSRVQRLMFQPGRALGPDHSVASR